MTQETDEKEYYVLILEEAEKHAAKCIRVMKSVQQVKGCLGEASRACYGCVSMGSPGWMIPRASTDSRKWYWHERGLGRYHGGQEPASLGRKCCCCKQRCPL